MDIAVVKANGKDELELFAQLSKRSGEVSEQVETAVRGIIADVKNRGDEAVKEYTLRFDGCLPERICIERSELESIARGCEPKLLAALERACENIRDYHSRQVRQGFVTAKENGVMLGQKIRGLNRVGIYVPGGTAAYVSSVLMNAIPARIAGVNEIIMGTPPGKASVDVLTGAYLAGVDRVYLVGGAQAVAALAFGTGQIPKVYKIVGPGNIYVATAKKQLFGVVDIDMIAGPSEVLIIADGGANPCYLAADMMSQAEHDPLSSAILLTTSEQVAKQTVAELERQAQDLSRVDIIRKSLKDFGAVVICDSLDQAIDYANRLAPEHLELMTENPLEHLGRVENAGSIFAGEYTPEPLGDYYAGPNHVLPTGGTARFFSPLSVDSFVKKSSFIYYTRDALQQAGEDVIAIANAEGLTAHANAIKVRMP